MKKPLVIISACQFTRLALESLIPADRYIVRVYSNVTTEVEFVLKTSCGYLLADKETWTGKPYLNLAALNEFSDGNKVRLGDESVNASIDGAAFRVGAGVQADITKNMGAYASLDYTKGDDIENPLQGVVGINVTW